MDYKFNYVHLICALSAVIIMLMYIYPIIFYIFLFVLYSFILIVCGESSDLLFLMTSKLLLLMLNLIICSAFCTTKSKQVNNSETHSSFDHLVQCYTVISLSSFHYFHLSPSYPFHGWGCSTFY